MRRSDFVYVEHRNRYTGRPELDHYYRPPQRDPRNVRAAKNGLWGAVIIGFAFSIPLWMAVIQDHWPRILHAIERIVR